MPPIVRYTLEIAAIACLFFILAAFFTWPLILDPGGYLLRGDPYFSVSALSWVAGRLPVDPTGIFNAPFFYPHSTTLAYSENFIGLQPFFIPLAALTGSDVAAYNLIFLAAFMLNALSIYLLCRFCLKLHPAAALLAGLVFAFSHYRHLQIWHLHILWTIWLPVGIWLLYETLRRNRWLPAIGVGIVFLLQSYASLHIMAYMAFALLLGTVFFIPFKRQSLSPLIKLAVTGAVCILLLIPLLMPYLHVREISGLERNIEEISGYSAQVQHFLAPSPFSNFPYQTILGQYSHPEKDLFIGIVALLLVITGLWTYYSKIPIIGFNALLFGYRFILIFSGGYIALTLFLAVFFPATIPVIRSVNNATLALAWMPLIVLAAILFRAQGFPVEKRWGVVLTALLITGAVFAAGPDIMLFGQSLGTGLYAAIADLPLAGAYRVTARWFILALLGASILAAMGLQKVMKNTGKITGLLLALGACVIALFEYAPLKGFSIPRLINTDREVYRWLSKIPGDFAVLELPLKPEIYDETLYMLAQRQHHKRIVNGYSGFASQQYRRLRARMNDLRTPDALPFLRSVLCRYVIVHLDDLTADERQQWLELADNPPEFVRDVRHFPDSLAFSLNWGGEGQYISFITPEDAAVIRSRIKCQFLDDDVHHILSVEKDGRSIKTVELANLYQEFQIQLQQDNRARDLAFAFSYLPKLPEPLGSGVAPIRLHVETGGKDPNHCIVGINGRYWSRDKGFNFYRLDNNGRVLEQRTFNTSWYEKANLEMSEYIASIDTDSEYFLIVSRHLAARRLNLIGRRALTSLGFTKIERMHGNSSIIGLVGGGENKPFIELVGARRKISFTSGKYKTQARFSLDLNILPPDSQR